MRWINRTAASILPALAAAFMSGCSGPGASATIGDNICLAVSFFSLMGAVFLSVFSLAVLKKAEGIEKRKRNE